jgi:hypothetical protein
MSESSSFIPEIPPEPLSFYIDLELIDSLVPEDDPSPKIIAIDLLNVEDILPPVPEAVPTPTLISSKLEVQPQSGLHVPQHEARTSSPFQVFRLLNTFEQTGSC